MKPGWPFATASDVPSNPSYEEKGIAPAGNGFWVSKGGEERRHVCRPPGALGRWIAMAKPGAQWKCNCGQLWFWGKDPESEVEQWDHWYQRTSYKRDKERE